MAQERADAVAQVRQHGAAVVGEGPGAGLDVEAGEHQPVQHELGVEPGAQPVQPLLDPLAGALGRVGGEGGVVGAVGGGFGRIGFGGGMGARALPVSGGLPTSGALLWPEIAPGEVATP